jgi:5-methyltetrahydropteroyltriglutamate--homocysteine methyltransferase
MSELPLLPTTVIGSYPRPKWLRELIRLKRAGRASDEDLNEGMKDAAIVVMRDQMQAGVDVPTDGEVRRDEMVEFFAERLRGFRFYGQVRVWGTAYYRKPAVIGRVEYVKPMLLEEFTHAKSISYTENLKVTITGPYTIAEWSYNEYYKDKRELTMELAKAINAEIRALVSAGARIIQVDEPAIHTHRDEVEWAVEAVNESIKGIGVKVVLHVCYGDYSLIAPYLNQIKVDQVNLALKNYDYRPLKLFRKYKWDREIGVGVIDVHNKRVETAEEVATDIKKVLDYFPVEMVWINPDCGLKLLPREIAYQKLTSMVSGAKIVRSKLSEMQSLKALPTLKPLITR